ncbi:helix-turn-helix domain-containing protein [Nocardiopsis flavescens]
MPSYSESSAQAARESVASRLKEIRLDAGLTGAELASRCGWHKSKSSRIENGKTPPSDADISAWCRVCGSPDRANDLIAASRNAESLYVEWRQRQRSGLRHIQESYVPLYEQTRLFRAYSPDVIPGFFQTPAYATAMLTSISEFWGLADDVQSAVSSRMDRSRFALQGPRHFAIVMEESALLYRVGDPETMAGQLGHLLASISMPNISLGIIPFASARTIWPLEGYLIFDDLFVQVELMTAELTIEAPTEVETYARAFGRLQKQAVYGSGARALITSAIEALD